MEDIMYHIYVKKEILVGLEDVRQGRVIPHEKVVEYFNKRFGIGMDDREARIEELNPKIELERSRFSSLHVFCSKMDESISKFLVGLKMETKKIIK